MSPCAPCVAHTRCRWGPGPPSLDPARPPSGGPLGVPRRRARRRAFSPLHRQPYAAARPRTLTTQPQDTGRLNRKTASSIDRGRRQVRGGGAFALNRAPQTTAGGETKHAKWTFGMKGNDSPRAPANMRTYFAIPGPCERHRSPRAAPRVAPCTCAYMRKRAAHGAPRRRRVSGMCSDGAPPRGRVTTVPGNRIYGFFLSRSRFRQSNRDGSSRIKTVT